MLACGGMSEATGLIGLKHQLEAWRQLANSNLDTHHSPNDGFSSCVNEISI
jgi:hypothetical protein